MTLGSRERPNSLNASRHLLGEPFHLNYSFYVWQSAGIVSSHPTAAAYEWAAEPGAEGSRAETT